MHLSCARILWLVFLLLFSAQAVSESEESPLPADAVASESGFDIQEANKKFDQISLKLSTINLNVHRLNQAISELEELTAKAEKCVEINSKKIVDLDEQIKKYFGEEDKEFSRVDSKYLENQKRNIAKKQAGCRLFMIRAQEAINAYREATLSLHQEITFTRGKSIEKRVAALPAEIAKLYIPQLDPAVITEKTRKNFYYILGGFFLLSLILSLRLHPFLHKKWRRHASLAVLHTILIFLGITFLFYSLFPLNLFKDPIENDSFNNLLMTASIFMLSIFALNYFFFMRRIPLLMEWYGFDVTFVKRLGRVIISIYFSRKIGIELLSLAHASDRLLRSYDDIFLLVSLFAMVYFTRILYTRHSDWFREHFNGTILARIITVVVFTLVALDFIGYAVLAVNTAYIIFSFLLVISLGTVLNLGIGNLYRLLSYHVYYQGLLKKVFGYASEPPYIELLIIKLIAQLVVTLSLCFLFAYLIGDASYFLDYFLAYIVDGFSISGLTIMPVQWVVGLVVFSVLILLARYIATNISRSQQFDAEEEIQVALASILLYVGFAVAVIIGLLIAGFSFTSLTIIAGALSVGIGLGLQSIVNNFFSGLILLIEKPIKAGDRIKIDNIEGFVKKVRVRSTQILTPAQEDIIIPNSDLITHQVTNFMFSDKYWRVKCSVGVAYGSDTKLVTEVLMQVAMGHPEILKSSSRKPMVLFREFGESSLLFELWCMIRNVNQKYIVASELNLAIDEAFRKHGITIAFPQRDVHIKIDDAKKLTEATKISKDKKNKK